MPEAVPKDYVKSPEEEFQYNNKPFIDAAIAGDFPVVTLIWHPWSLRRLDPEMRMLEMTFDYVRDHGLPSKTFAQYLPQVPL
jgi:hypothetical protein